MTRKPLDRAAREATGATTVRVTKATAAAIRQLVQLEERQGSHRSEHYSYGFYRRYAINSDTVLFALVDARLAQLEGPAAGAKKPKAKKTRAAR